MLTVQTLSHVVSVVTMRTSLCDLVRSSLPFLFVLVCLLLPGSALSQDPIETIRIETDLVELRVSVLSSSSSPTPLLGKDDFAVWEDGRQQDIAFFESADAPFDLVLLLDLSGSNRTKLKMIKNSAKRFFDVARPVDRIALVTFTDRPALYSTFSLDRKKLKRSIDDIDEASGGTNFWDSLNFVLTKLIKEGSGNRRSAIVLMTDGIDNALTEVPGPGSQITFDDLLTNIRNSETIIFPIYLDTEEEMVKDFRQLRVSRVDYALAREQLAQIAATCATTMYTAAKLSDLDELYGRVIRDLSTVYSIGYRPSNKTLDGKWRSVEVRLPERPNLLARAKRGYFAKLEPSP